MNKGFTLIELLGVITVLAILSLITVPIIDRSLNQGKEGLSKIQNEQILKGLENYYAENINLLNTLPFGEHCENLKTLKENGYLPADIKNIKNNTNIDENDRIYCVNKTCPYTIYGSSCKTNDNDVDRTKYSYYVKAS